MSIPEVGTGAVALVVPTAMRDAPDLATHLQGGGFDFAFAELPATATNVLVLPGPDHSTGFGLPRPSG